MKLGAGLRLPRGYGIGAALAVALLAAMLVLLTARSTRRHSHLPRQEPAAILRRGNGPEPESLDPHRARSEAALTILRDLYEGLTEIGPDGAPVLAAADQYTVSADGRSYSFHLRRNARWSNGEPLQAEDFAAAWRRLVDPHTGAQYAQLLAAVRGAAAITAGPGGTFDLGSACGGRCHAGRGTRTPHAILPRAARASRDLSLNRASLALHGRGFAKPGLLVSNGAFVLTRWDFGSHLVAVRNHRYWNDGATRLGGVEYYSMSEPSTELRAFRAGELDTTDTVPAAQFAWIKEHLGQELHVEPQLAVYYLGLNLRMAPLANSPQLRQALSLVIDRERLVQAVTGTGESPAYTFVPGSTANYSPPLPEYAGWPMARRIARARELLAGAGLLQAPPPISVYYNSGELHSRIAVAVARMWKEALGIDASLHAEEFKVLLQDIDRGDVAQVFRASWLADYDDAYSFLQVLQSGFGINLPHYASARYDELLENAANQLDPARRRGMLQDAERAMLDDQPLIPLYFYVSKHLVSRHVTGWRGNVMNVVYSKQLAKDDVQSAR